MNFELKKAIHYPKVTNIFLMAGTVIDNYFHRAPSYSFTPIKEEALNCITDYTTCQNFIWTYDIIGSHLRWMSSAHICDLSWKCTCSISFVVQIYFVHWPKKSLTKLPWGWSMEGCLSHSKPLITIYINYFLRLICAISHFSNVPKLWKWTGSQGSGYIFKLLVLSNQ